MHIGRYSFFIIICLYFSAQYGVAHNLNLKQKYVLSNVANACILGTPADLRRVLNEDSVIIQDFFTNYYKDFKTMVEYEQVIKFVLLQETSEYLKELLNFFDSTCSLDLSFINNLLLNIKHYLDDGEIFIKHIQCILEKLDFKSKLFSIQMAIEADWSNALLVVDSVLLSLVILEVRGIICKNVMENQKNAITLLVKHLSCIYESAELLGWAISHPIEESSMEDATSLIEEYKKFIGTWLGNPLKHFKPEENLYSCQDICHCFSQNNFFRYPILKSSLPFLFIFSTLPHFRKDPKFEVYCKSIDKYRYEALDCAIFENRDYTEVLALAKLGSISKLVGKRVELLKRAISLSLPEILELLLVYGIDVKNDENALSLAIKRGDYEIIQIVLKYGASDESEISNGNWSKLLTAVAKDNIEEVERLLIEGAVIKTSHYSALNMAVYNNNFGIASLLLNHGASLLDIDGEKVAPLFLAIELNRIGLVESFLNQITDSDLLKVKDKEGSSLLLAAVKVCNFKAILLLVGRFPDFEFIRALEVAINSKESSFTLQTRLETVRAILKSGFDASLNEISNLDILISTLQRGHYLILNLLLDYGFDINMKNSVGENILSRAMEHVNFTMTRFALKRGANPNTALKHHHYRIALIPDSDDQDFQDIFKLVRMYKPDINLSLDKYGNTLLMDAASKNDLREVQYWLRNGVDPTIKNIRGETALVIAASKMHDEVANELIDNRVITPDLKVEFRAALKAAFRDNIFDKVPEFVNRLISFGVDISGLLVYCAKQNGEWHVSMINLLIENVANVDECDENNLTSLDYAIKNRNLPVAKLLLNKGAKFNVESFNSILPKIIGEGNHNLGLVNLLLEYGADMNIINDSRKALQR